MNMEKNPVSYRYCNKNEQEFPGRLRKYARMPKGLYVIGELPADDQPSVAIVGARMCSNYGASQSYHYAKALAARGVQIISGMARGIDAAAHQGALDADGRTFAVLGCGVDVCYPRQNRVLYKCIQKRGGILSELEPGDGPAAWHFPIRNRIISALADLVLVVEAGQKSGSLITVDYALEQGVPVFAIPGRVGEPLSFGVNRLIYDGAGIAYSPEILLEELGIVSKRKQKTDRPLLPRMNEKQKRVYDCLSLDPQDLNTILQQVSMPVYEVTDLLIELQLNGVVQEVSKNQYVRKTGK